MRRDKDKEEERHMDKARDDADETKEAGVCLKTRGREG